MNLERHLTLRVLVSRYATNWQIEVTLEYIFFRLKQQIALKVEKIDIVRNVFQVGHMALAISKV